MNAEGLIDSLERFRAILPAVVGKVPADDARWKPSDGAWSILEVVSHLADEEELDFRVRLRSTLTDPRATWPPIDPEGWAVERNYNAGDLRETVDRFVALRGESVAWLRSLNDVDWSVSHRHPRLGTMRAGDMLSAWAAHDSLHLRQIAKRLFQLTQRDAEEYTTSYAGEWTE